MCCCTQCESKSKLAPAANETQKSRSPDPFSETQRPILVTQQSLFVFSLRKSSKWGRSLTFLIKFDSSKSILLGRSDSRVCCALHTPHCYRCVLSSVCRQDMCLLLGCGGLDSHAGHCSGTCAGALRALRSGEQVMLEPGVTHSHTHLLFSLACKVSPCCRWDAARTIYPLAWR